MLFYFLTVLIGMSVTLWLTLFSLRHLFFLIKNKKISLKPAFRGFKEKMWMTCGLGLIFFGFYFSVVSLSSYYMTAQARLDFFLLVYSHPTEFIYLGLFIFAIATLSIYLVRMIIKYIFINKGSQ